VLNLNGVTTNQAGFYSVIVSNLVNSVTSAPVQLRVKQVAMFIGNQLLTNGTYNFTTNPIFTVRSSFTNGSAYYTLNGSPPNFLSTFYSGPFTLFGDATVRALGYSADFSQSEEADAVNAIVIVHHKVFTSSTGGGSVNLSPPGGDYLSSDTVTASAVANPGWSFLYWTGSTNGSNAVVTFDMHHDRAVHAVFGTTLSTTVTGNGQVLLYPPGGIYPYGKVVRLSAVPQSGNYFGTWGNAASGQTANPLYFTVTNPNPTVSSVFGTTTAGQAALTVLINGAGTVNVSPSANVYSTGDLVTLTPIAAPGQSFINWSGDASGTQNPLGITMSQDKVITANFTSVPLFRINPQFGEGLRPEGFRFSLLSDPGSVYEIRSSTNSTVWESLGYVTNSIGEIQMLDPGAIDSPWKLYRRIP
jgi:hypothetical protein